MISANRWIARCDDTDVDGSTACTVFVESHRGIGALVEVLAEKGWQVGSGNHAGRVLCPAHHQPRDLRRSA
jgi:hypothetical protein